MQWLLLCAQPHCWGARSSIESPELAESLAATARPRSKACPPARVHRIRIPLSLIPNPLTAKLSRTGGSNSLSHQAVAGAPQTVPKAMQPHLGLQANLSHGPHKRISYGTGTCTRETGCTANNAPTPRTFPPPSILSRPQEPTNLLVPNQRLCPNVPTRRRLEMPSAATM